MATPVKTPTAPAANKAPAAPAPATPTPEAAPKKAKAKKVKWTEIFATAEAATQEAADRDGGPRRPFKVTKGDKTIYCVVHNEHHALAVMAAQDGYTAEPLTGRKKSKPVGIGGILELVNALPEGDRAAIFAQIEKLKGSAK